MAKSLFIVGPWGLGDSIYVRPFIAATAQRRDVYYETPWPELFHDLPLRLVRGQRRLRTQMRNLARTRQEQWFRPPDDARTIRLGYGVLEVANGNVATAMEIKLPPLNKLNPVWDLPELGKCPFDTGGAPLAIIRPVMRRIEWDNEARNPYPQYVDEIAGDLKARGFATVVIADLKHGYEWIEGGRLPPHNVALTNGELSVRQLLAAVRDAAVVVGPVGWIVPAAIALHTRAFIILGGNGGMNAPEKIIDPRMDAKRIGFATPERFCLCTDMRHRCDKRIPDLGQQWQSWMRSVRLPVPRSSASSRRSD
ncbi:MAG TPA: hypothetical protein VL614_00415 [Acetobacteraceae bacterium]|jgi:hypothetical protein|nr:hypothetical protein [Acetobacteraceae bacterium]